MPGKVKVKIISGRNLPVMDRSSDTTDAYVEIKLGTTTYKTDVCRKSLHPQWNSEWYRFEMDDSELQDEPLQIRLMDHDTYSANDAIGKVYLDLNPLLLPATSLLGKWNDGSNSSHEGNNSVMSGWIPVYDTMHGIRGEVNVIVKVELFSDFNKFRQSSCGVQFFCSPAIPHGFYAQVIHGFVEELVVNDDPEYQWIDKIRTPRASNEARQTLFFKLSGELQRKIGLKALEMGGNAVIGYTQCFDLEGESGIVARGIGTAVTLVKIMDLPSSTPENNQNEERALSYLKFLGSAKSFYLNNEYYSNMFVHNYNPYPTASISSLKLEEGFLHSKAVPRHLTRHLSDKEFYPMPQKQPLHHSLSLQTLLKQEEKRRRPGYGISQRFRNLKYTSQNIITRKMTKLKAKLATDGDENEAAAENAGGRKRTSFIYRRTQSDSSGMAELLVRSVFDATTSLGCIAESPKLTVDGSEPKETSFLSLPAPASSIASSKSSIDEDDDDEDDDEDEGDTLEPLEELDTVSHIVETVRKLSMIQSPSALPDQSQLDYDQNKFLFVIGDDENDTRDENYDLVEVGDANLLYYDETDTQSFFPHFARAFRIVKKSTTAKSLSDMVMQEDSLHKKFTSLHNIHHATSKVNRYSEHGGKETVLGELFRRIDNARSQSDPELAIATNNAIRDEIPIRIESCKHVNNIEFRISQEIKKSKENVANQQDVLQNAPGKLLMESVSGTLATRQLDPGGPSSNKAYIKNSPSEKQQLVESDELRRNQLPKLLIPCQDLPNINTTTEQSGEIKSAIQERDQPECDANTKIKTPHSAGFLPKKVLKVLHKLDQRLHHSHHKNSHQTKDNDKGAIKNDQGLLNIALGNVLMDSVNEVLATSHSDSPKCAPTFMSLDSKAELPTDYAKEVSQETNQDNVSENLSITGQHKHHGIMQKIKDGKDKIFHAPMDLFHRLHHESHKGEIKNEHGLLNIALGNVLRDSVQEVLATSHSDSPNNTNRNQNVFNFDIPEEGTSHKPNLPGHSHVLELETSDNEEEMFKNAKLEIEEENLSLNEEHKHHGIMQRIIEGKDKILHAPIDLYHHLDSKMHHESHKGEIKNEHGLLNIALGNVLMDSVQEVLATSHTASPNNQNVFQFEVPEEETTHKPHLPGHSHVLELDTSEHEKDLSKEVSLVNDEETLSLNEEHKHHGIMQKIKDGRDKILHAPMDLYHHLDSKMHHESHKGEVKNEHGLLNIALGNVLMDSVQEVVATSHTASPNNQNVFQFEVPEEETTHKPHLPGHSHVLELDTSEHEKDLSKEVSLANDEETLSLNQEHKHHGIMQKIKDGRDKILHAPMDLYHHLDSKMHHESHKGEIKNEHGLLNIALGNVLMDSVQEVLATSHTASPIDQNVFQFEVPEEETTHKPHLLGHSHVLDLETSENEKEKIIDTHKEIFKESELEIEEENLFSNEEHKHHGIMQRIRDGKDAILHAPKELFHRLDSKIHDSHKGEIKHEHGLLSLALGNVLMDSVQEVLATSHSASPQSGPQSPAFKPVQSSPIHIVPMTSPTSNAQSINLLAIDSEHNNNKLNTITKCLSQTQSNAGQRLNTQIDDGNSDCINTEHACLTTLRNLGAPYTDAKTENGHQRTESLGVRISHSPAKVNAIPCIHRRSSDSDLSITPKGNSLTGSDRSGGYSSGQYMRGAMIRTTRPQENFDIMEYPFLTLSKYPAGFIAHIGGSVSARSVKLLERITNLEEPESRDTWWSEIRMEIRSHARALNCNAVLGYTESTSICDDVCVLSASGTAAVLGYQQPSEATDSVSGLPILPKTNATTMSTSLDRTDFEKDKQRSENKPKVTPPITTNNINNNSPEREREPPMKSSCAICHLPYYSNTKPLRASSIKCATCGAYKVPDMLIATIEMPDGMLNIGRGCFIQSYVCRPLKDLKGESNAKEISDGLPFLEYELHRFLINKLKVKGMNAIFGLKVRISVGERMLIGIATGTAVFLSPLPPPLLPKLVSDRTTDEKKLTLLQKNLHDTIKKNREIYQLRSIEEVTNGSTKLLSDTDDSEDEHAALDLAVGNKDCCILEVDDPDDVDVLNSLMEPRPPDGFHVVNTEQVPGLEDLEIVKNLQMFTQIWRAKIPPPFALDKHFHRLLQSVYFKLRRMIPCALCDLQFRVDSPEPDEIQLCVLGMALGLGDPFKNAKAKRKNVIPKKNDDDMIFNLEEDQIPEHSVVQMPQPTAHLLHAQTLKHRQKSPTRNKLLTRQRHVPYRERHGVDITPLSYVPGGKIEKYLGNLNFFFIRETTSLREEGGLSGFVHSFITEVLAIVRAHVTALSGNAMVGYFITECVLNHNLHKNQGQCLINVGGDVVYVSYFAEDH